MSDQIDLTTIVFALVAVFVVWKMRTILGTRNESNPNPAPRPQNGSSSTSTELANRSAANASNDDLRWMPFAAFGTEMWQRLDEISKIDSSFNPREFVEGSKMAYDMILKGFSGGDLAALKPLLGKDVFESFSAAVSERRHKKAQLETTLVSIDRSEMKEVKIEGKSAQIVMRFVAKVISVTRDENGLVLEGAPDKVTEVVDVWTFQRDLNSYDPNWRLISTEEPH
jgi:predicted lipid-binding transport protein (Tim44 family)